MMPSLCVWISYPRWPTLCQQPHMLLLKERQGYFVIMFIRIMIYPKQSQARGTLDSQVDFGMRYMIFCLGTKLVMSTTFRPQTDEHTERVNPILEDMLRHYVNLVQDDWDELLAAVEFAYNNSWQESVRNTPFFLNYDQHPRTPISGNNMCEVPIAQDFVEHMTNVIGLTKKHLIVA